MPKVEVSVPSRLYEQLVARVEEEGTTKGVVIRDALTIHLGVVDPKPAKKALPQYENGGLARLTISIPEEWLWELNMMAEERTTPKRKVSGAAVIREMVREALGKPVPEVLERAPRRPDLSRDIIIESQVDDFNHMRNLRTSQEGKEKPVELPVWERIRANPEEFFHVNLCRVKGCHNQDMGLHRHPGMHLADYADAVEEGGRT